MTNFSKFFTSISGNDPHPWQDTLGSDGDCQNRLIRIPTGFGKTAGTVLPWLWHRVVQQNNKWPIRLVFCLPMRVLVEQTEANIRGWLKSVDLLWDDKSDHAKKVGVHVLMGGCDAGDWHLYPEHPAILIGTQDMLLSRALNRGYASGRAKWPMEFGLLNHDGLWVVDEVQLMDVGLATSAQLQAFRDDIDLPNNRPCKTWWMSATMQLSWLSKSPETVRRSEELQRNRISIPDELRVGDLWEQVHKPVTVESFKDHKAMAKHVAELHASHRHEGITLVVMNTVDRAVDVATALRNAHAASEIELIHSRFRREERKLWLKFLRRDACAAGVDRIIVATQVVEAGVDISARVLVTELAPWPNLVQRFGRAARWADAHEANIVVAEFNLSEKKTAPYEADSLQAAREALANVTDVAPLYLERFEEQHPELVEKLYPYEPQHLLLRRELDELFDTTPDLSGGDVDISRFIRSGDERDVQVFWADIPPDTQPPSELRATHEALCSVPFLKAADWLCGDKKRSTLLKGMRAWVWDWLDGAWRRCERRDCWPGQTILVAANCGGYLSASGWTPDATEPVTVVIGQVSPDEQTDDSQDDEALSAYSWRSIATHGGDVAAETQSMTAMLDQRLAALLHLAGRWHDVGKAHPAFQNSIKNDERKSLQAPARQDLAKAPKTAWVHVSKLYPMPPHGRRAGFRHELASTLALFDVLRRHKPEHSALLGPWCELLGKAGRAPDLVPTTVAPANILEQEIVSLSADDFDLLAYLVCSHHGKVRMTWHACPADQEAGDSVLRIRGIRNHEKLPSLPLLDNNNQSHQLPESTLDLAPSAVGLDVRFGRGWTERVIALRQQYGPFKLAWLEACLRAADMRASRIKNVDERVGRI